jgi:hypothetical protein
MSGIDHFKIPCEPADGVRTVPVAKRSFTVLVGPGEREDLTAAVFVDDALATSYRLAPDELPGFLRWMGGYCEQVPVPLRFGAVGRDDDQGVPLPCPPPDPPEPRIAGPALQEIFAQLWLATGRLFTRSRRQ